MTREGGPGTGSRRRGGTGSDATGFSRPFQVGEITEEGRPFTATASPAECRALASRFGLVAVMELTVDGSVRRKARRTRYHLSGHLRARVVQTCVVTLEPVEAQLDVPLEADYATDLRDEWGEQGDQPPGAEIVLSLADGDAPEPIVGGVLDVGEAAAQELALALDPFPRAPGAGFAGYGTNEPRQSDHDEEKASPFAGLADLRKKAARKP